MQHLEYVTRNNLISIFQFAVMEKLRNHLGGRMILMMLLKLRRALLLLFRMFQVKRVRKMDLLRGNNGTSSTEKIELFVLRHVIPNSGL